MWGALYYSNRVFILLLSPLRFVSALTTPCALLFLLFFVHAFPTPLCITAWPAILGTTRSTRRARCHPSHNMCLHVGSEPQSWCYVAMRYVLQLLLCPLRERWTVISAPIFVHTACECPCLCRVTVSHVSAPWPCTCCTSSSMVSILRLLQYSTAVDMWSVGAILADLLGRRPLFPGRDFRHQISTIVSVLGTPADAETAHVTSPTARSFLASLPVTAPTPLSSLLPGAPDEALDLVARLLRFDPAARLSAAQALDHPYVAAFHEPALEGVAGEDVLTRGPLEPPAGDLPPSVLRGLMWREVLAFHPGAVGVAAGANGGSGVKRDIIWAGESESPRSSMPA